MKRLVGMCFFAACAHVHAAFDVALNKGAVALTQLEVETDTDAIFLQDFYQVFLQDINLPGRMDASLRSSSKSVADYRVSFKATRASESDAHQVCMYVSLGGGKRFSDQDKLYCQTFLPGAWREHVHQYSEVLYKRLLQMDAPFTHKMVYVKEVPASPRVRYALELADYDGGNPKMLVSSKEPITSVSVSPDGKKIAYVSFEHHQSQAYIYDLDTNTRQALPHYPGVNGAVSWSPDSKQLATSLSISGAVQIYIMDMESKRLTKATTSSSIEVDPVWSKDGNHLFFVSHRGEGVHIYKMHLASRTIEKVTAFGAYNVSPSLSDSGDKMVYLSRVDHRLQAVLMDIEHGKTQLIGSGRLDDAPKISKDGEYVLYSSVIGGNRFVHLKVLATGKARRLPIKHVGGKFLAWVQPAVST